MCILHICTCDATFLRSFLFANKDEFGASRLKKESIVVEVKKTRIGLDHELLGEQVIIDVDRYSVRQDCKRFVVFIYDREG